MSEILDNFSKVEVKNVVFLTPAKVKLLIDGKEKILMTSVDIINRKVYLVDGEEFKELSNAVFSHLDQINTLPEDFFMAPDEVVEEAVKADLCRQETFKESMGVMNE
jgi:hypothetical protein